MRFPSPWCESKQDNTPRSLVENLFHDRTSFNNNIQLNASYLYSVYFCIFPLLFYCCPPGDIKGRARLKTGTLPKLTQPVTEMYKNSKVEAILQEIAQHSKGIDLWSAVWKYVWKLPVERVFGLNLLFQPCILVVNAIDIMVSMKRTSQHSW